MPVRSYSEERFVREMDDNEIITRCLSGEMEAFELLVRKYQSSLLSLSWHIMGDKEEARDITQEAFIQSYKNLDRFDAGKSFKNWIFAIAYRRCLDRIKKQPMLPKINTTIRSPTLLFDEYAPIKHNSRIKGMIKFPRIVVNFAS